MSFLIALSSTSYIYSIRWQHTFQRQISQNLSRANSKYLTGSIPEGESKKIIIHHSYRTLQWKYWKHPFRGCTHWQIPALGWSTSVSTDRLNWGVGDSSSALLNVPIFINNEALLLATEQYVCHGEGGLYETHGKSRSTKVNQLTQVLAGLNCSLVYSLC